ncbi:hypothetical protein HYV88_00670 [Candidatus Woesearchaeota archaeon]|nr:hypothetical protein [Candidatus Woesearchaeota archaeon]
MNHKLISFLVFLILSINLASAVSVSNIQASTIFPGESTYVSITLENNLDDTVEKLSISLVLDKTPFITIGSSEKSIDELKENRQRNFEFQIKAPNDIKPGNYNIPYSILYNLNDQSEQKQGTFGITVDAKTELSFSGEVENNIVGEKGKVSLKIVNNGLADLRFVSVKLVPVGFTLTSPDEVYIGTVNSDDFETANFDVIFTGDNSKLSSIVNYRDFNNNVKSEVVDIPLNVYTREKALELGLIKKSYIWIYVIIVLAVLVLWFIYRKIKKRRRLNK